MSITTTEQIQGLNRQHAEDMAKIKRLEAALLDPTKPRTTDKTNDQLATRIMQLEQEIESRKTDMEWRIAWTSKAKLEIEFLKVVIKNLLGGLDDYWKTLSENLDIIGEARKVIGLE